MNFGWRSACSQELLRGDKDGRQKHPDQPCHQKKPLRHMTWRIEFPAVHVTGKSSIVYDGALQSGQLIANLERSLLPMLATKMGIGP